MSENGNGGGSGAFDPFDPASIAAYFGEGLQAAEDARDTETTRAQRMADDRKIKEAFGALQATEGWPIFIANLDRQIELRTQKIIGEAGNYDRMIQKEYAAGEIAGLRIARDLVEHMRGSAEDSLRSMAEHYTDSADHEGNGEEEEYDNGAHDGFPLRAP